MFKLFLTAALVACANGYYNHGPIAHHESYYGGHYGHGVPSVPLPAVNHGNIYNHGYGHDAAKIIPATYPGAVHNAAAVAAGHAVANPTHGYVGRSGFAEGAAVNHAAASYVHAPQVIAAHAPIAYNPAGPAATYAAHSHYAVTEGPSNYAAHSRYALAAAPALRSYGHHARYPVVPAAASVYSHGAAVDHRVQKIAYTPAISHMGYQSHAAQSYSW